jgi:hypothetical protein
MSSPTSGRLKTMSDWTELVKKTTPPPAEKYPILKLPEGEHQIKFLTDSPRIINTTTLDGKPVQKAIFDVELVEDGQKYALFTAVAGPSSLFGQIAALKKTHKTLVNLTVKIKALGSGRERRYYISV